MASISLARSTKLGCIGRPFSTLSHRRSNRRFCSGVSLKLVRECSTVKLCQNSISPGSSMKSSRTSGRWATSEKNFCAAARSAGRSTPICLAAAIWNRPWK